MRRIICILNILILSTSYVCSEKYTTKYDNIDLDQIINNDRLLKKYIDCGLDKAPCIKDAQILKDHIVDALETDCSKSSEKRQAGIKKVITHLATNKPDWWKALTAKYDSEGVYRKKYKDVLEKEGIFQGK